MALILLVVALVLAVAFFQVVQGIYAALIMMLASLVSAAVAFAYFEPLAEVLYPQLHGAAEGVAMGGLFGVCLLVLRLGADHFLHHNVVVGVWANRIGAGALGLVAALVIMGTVMTAVQLLPLGSSILGFKPFNESLQRQQVLAPFQPDQFTAGLVDLMSLGSLKPGSGKTLGVVHRNLLQEAAARRNTAGLNGSITAPSNSLMVTGSYAPEYDATMTWMDQVPDDPLRGQAQTNILIVRVAVDASAADADKWWRLPATHFRLIGKDGNSAYPVAYLFVGQGRWQVAAAPVEEGQTRITSLVAARSAESGKMTVDWVFRVDPNFVADTLSFRMRSYAGVPAAVEEMPPPSAALPGAGDTAARPQPPQPRPARPTAPAAK